jgi:hypothetical protein
VGEEAEDLLSFKIESAKDTLLLAISSQVKKFESLFHPKRYREFLDLVFERFQRGRDIKKTQRKRTAVKRGDTVLLYFGHELWLQSFHPESDQSSFFLFYSGLRLNCWAKE